MVFHLVALPHTNVNKEHSACAFNQKVLKFAQMMKSLNHTVFLYSSEKYDAPCDEHITCITEEERVACLGGKHYTQASFDYNLPHWVKFNQLVVENIRMRIEPKDFICVIGGLAHKSIADSFPKNMTVEFGIGYGGTFSPYRVFESYAWMHTVYGAQEGTNGASGKWFDAVIPSYFNVKEFPFVEKKQDYFLFIGRLTADKGFSIAVEVCEKLKKKLIIAGPGEPPVYGEYVGVVGPKKRAELMGNAQAVFVPTTYIEPFGSVAVEAQLCGTPVITTDWGAFVETVEDGVTGYRCRTFQDFLWGATYAHMLDPKEIRERAVKLYDMENVKIMYQQYFERLLTLWDKGWYQIV